MLRQNNHRRSKLQEAKAASDYGGKTRPGSGNQWHSKGDVITPDYLIECKTTTKSSYSLKCQDLLKIWKEAISESKIPVFEIEFSTVGLSYVLLEKNDFLGIIQQLEGESE
jgi:hypothetical protein